MITERGYRKAYAKKEQQGIESKKVKQKKKDLKY